MAFALSDEQLDRWRQFLEQAKADPAWVEKNGQIAVKRPGVRDQIVEFLQAFLRGDVDTEELRGTFDRKTRTEWVGFGLKGMSGAMFLNMLVKHVPDGDALTKQLKDVIPVPSSEDEGRARMRVFAEFLSDLIESGQAAKRQIQPARLPFFVSSLWHLQDTELWPPFYLTGRKALTKEGLYRHVSDGVEAYFSFREAFMAIAEALGLGSWAFEHLLIRLAKSESKLQTWHGLGAEATTGGDDGEDEETDGTGGIEEATDGYSHTQVQHTLARIGRKVGCRIWIAANDRNKEWKGERLGDLSIAELPQLGLDGDSQRLIGLIDVLWIKGSNQVVAAFEVEHTTSIYSGLLRMSDLATMSPNLNIPLYIVAPAARIDKVRRELSRPTFQTLELHQRCSFFSYEDLMAHIEAIMQWATDPSAIEKLAEHVEAEVEEEEL